MKLRKQSLHMRFVHAFFLSFVIVVTLFTVAWGIFFIVGITNGEIAQSLLYTRAPVAQKSDEVIRAEVAKARDRAIKHPQIDLEGDSPENVVLKLSKEYQITYEGKEDKFTINIYSPKLNETRKKAEMLLTKLLGAPDKQVLCRVNVLIGAHPKANPEGDWGPYQKLSACSPGGFSALDKVVPKAHACIDVWSYDPDCTCALLQPYFGVRAWAARLIASRESSCNTSATGPFGEAGLFQIYPGGSYNVITNIQQAVAKSSGGTNFTAWTVCSFRNFNDCSGPINICFPGPDTGGYSSSCRPPEFNITGTVFLDHNRNGRQDGGEGGYGGLTVRLSNGSSSTTNGSGNYGFFTLSPGTYTASITVPAGYLPTTATSRGVTGPPNQVVNFGIVPVYDISGTVILDHNRDGIQNNGEGGCNACQVRLSGFGISRTTTTNGSGGYIFTNLYAGTYTVSITVPTDYINTTPTSRAATVGPDATGINFGITNLHIVRGSVFIDPNKDGFQDAGEVTYGGPITISSSRGTPRTSGSTFEVWFVPIGPVRISYTNLQVPDYYMTYPRNGPPPSLDVTVGVNVCNPAGARGATCDRGDINGVKFGISNIYPWFQAACGNIRMDNGMTNRIFAGNNAMTTDASCTTPGIIFSGDTSSFLGKGGISNRGWFVGGTSYPEVFKSNAPLLSSYTLLDTKATQGNIAVTNLSSVCNISNCTLPANLPRGIYRANGNVVLNSYRFPAGRNYIFLINGSLRIMGDINVSTGGPTVSTVLFSSTGDIIVDSSVGTNTSSSFPNLEGIYTTDDSFIVESYGEWTCLDLRLNIAGAVVVNAGRSGGGFRNDRDTCGAQVTDPTIQFIQRVDIVTNLPEFVKKQDSFAWEANP